MSDTEPKYKYLLNLKAVNLGPHTNLNVGGLELSDKKSMRVAIFASNGGGKSSLSKQFRLLNMLENLPASEKFITLGQTVASIDFSLFDQKASPIEYRNFNIIHKKGDAPKITNNTDFIFHVFNSDYVRESIYAKNYGQNGKIEGYILGKANVDLSKEKDEYENLRKKYVNLKAEIEQAIENSQCELKKLEIKASTNEFKNFTFEKIIGDFSPENESDSYDDLKSKLTILKGMPEELGNVSSHRNIDYDITFISGIEPTLKEVITPSKLSLEFKSKILKKEGFIREGVRIIKEENISQCPFCEQTFSENENQLIEKFVEYIEDSETVYRGKLEMLIGNISSLALDIDALYKNFLEIESQFNANKKYFPSFQNKNLHISVIENNGIAGYYRIFDDGEHLAKVNDPNNIEIREY